MRQQHRRRKSFVFNVDNFQLLIRILLKAEFDAADLKNKSEPHKLSFFVLNEIFLLESITDEQFRNHARSCQTT